MAPSTSATCRNKRLDPRPVTTDVALVVQKDSNDGVCLGKRQITDFDKPTFSFAF